MVKISERLEELDVMRKIDDKIYVLGRARKNPFSNKSRRLQRVIHDADTGDVISELYFREPFDLDREELKTSGACSFFGFGLPFFIPLAIYHALPGTRDRVKKARGYHRNVKQFQDANMIDLREAVKDIRIYQGSAEEVSRDIGRPLERVDTGKPETFVIGEDTFWLRVAAHYLGANAVVNCQPGSSTGTPVRYAEEK